MGQGLIRAIIALVLVGGIARAQDCAVDPYAIDPTFDPANLTGDDLVWWNRVHASAADEGSSPNWPVFTGTARGAHSNNTYRYGRDLNLLCSSFLSALRETHSRAFLDSIAVITSYMADSLKDEWVDGTTDGYRGWWWKNETGTDLGGESQWGGNDWHWDASLTASWLAEATWAYTVNAAVDPVYAEQAAFYRDFLWNDYQAKWVERSGGGDPINPSDADLAGAYEDEWVSTVGDPGGMTKSLWHGYMASARLVYFMNLLFPDRTTYFAARSDSLNAAWLADLELVGSHYVWPHDVTNTSPVGYQEWGYARYTLAALLPLLELGWTGDGNRYAETVYLSLQAGTSSEMADLVDGTGTQTLDADAFSSLGAFAQYGRYVTILAAAAQVYSVSSSFSVPVCGYALRGATP